MIAFTCHHPLVVDGQTYDNGCGDLMVDAGRARLLRTSTADGTGTTGWAAIGCPSCGAPTLRELGGGQYEALEAIGVDQLPPTMAARAGELAGVPGAWDALVRPTLSPADLVRAGEVGQQLERLLKLH